MKTICRAIKSLFHHPRILGDLCPVSIRAPHTKRLFPARYDVLISLQSRNSLGRCRRNVRSRIARSACRRLPHYLTRDCSAKSRGYTREKIIHCRSKVLFGGRISISKSSVSYHHHRWRGNHRRRAVLGLDNSPVVMLCSCSRWMISKSALHAISFIVSCIDIIVTFNSSAAIDVAVSAGGKG